jgi:hypothetical protein
MSFRLRYRIGFSIENTVRFGLGITVSEVPTDEVDQSSETCGWHVRRTCHPSRISGRIARDAVLCATEMLVEEIDDDLVDFRMLRQVGRHEAAMP